MLLGESGGVLPAGNIDGNEEAELSALPLPELPGTWRGMPALASSSSDKTCTSNIRAKIVFRFI